MDTALALMCTTGIQGLIQSLERLSISFKPQPQNKHETASNEDLLLLCYVVYLDRCENLSSAPWAEYSTVVRLRLSFAIASNIAFQNELKC